MLGEMSAPSTIDPTALDLSALRLPPDAHKGSRGSVGILGGAAGMLGAAWLAGRAALHGGAGRVYVGQMDPAAPVVDPLYPELMLRCAADLLAGWDPAPTAVEGVPAADTHDPPRLPLTALVAGPGMGTAPQAVDLLVQALDTLLPLLLDADALNLLARRADLADRLRGRAPASTILTPHPAEAARLLYQSVEDVQSDRPAAARALAERYGAIVILKGAGTLVAWRAAASAASPATSRTGSSDAIVSTGITIARNPTGSNRLATAGTGDVLSGLIGALLARGLDAPTAAQLGAWVHGRAGENMPDQHPTASALLPIIAAELAALDRGDKG
jgi:hydroxyethylthiazole kinase-like uncharacterized protein yjeF